MTAFWNVLRVNTMMEFLELRRYKANTISLLLTFYIIFVGMMFGIQVVGDPAQASTNTQYVIVNYIFWYFGMMTLQSIGWTISDEAMKGTLEQLYMSPVKPWKILLSRLLGTIFNHFVLVVVLLFLSMATAGEWLNVNPVTIFPILVLTLAGMIGTSFIVAGMALVFKQINAFLQILQFIVAGLTFVPLSVAPFMVGAPFVKGVDMTRQIMIHGYTLADFSMGDYAWLIGNTVVYGIIGFVFYNACEKHAMQKGLLGHY
ncbi:ABC transporter permease [Lentibacillus salicampi]|uniref:ABC transporter permease n=1 Tax=Lentibacillus salicampi TaxID=175306 RepID=A0A4Y9AIQ9_9BACI|nr:ABC transporter permease [Lentibacillus salicampi]TFJ94311.1 ABC transporter permease [Lentibacillus salicampi]